MSELCKETLCASCIHRNVCAIKDDYLKIFKALPKHNDIFSIKVNCGYYTSNNSTRLRNYSSDDTINNLIKYETTTGSPLESKIDI